MFSYRVLVIICLRLLLWYARQAPPSPINYGSEMQVFFQEQERFGAGSAQPGWDNHEADGAMSTRTLAGRGGRLRPTRQYVPRADITKNW